jgi:heat-inducible transcriptional repressor
MLTSRQRQILKSIIDIYIKTAEPVGSKMLAECCEFGLSSATLRNEMAELLEQGYLEQPHTSAGRVPTHKGYRLYVNELMNEYALTSDETAELKNALRTRIARYDRMTDEIGKVLSELTNYAAITVTPKMTAASVIRRIDIVRCDNFIYVILVIMGSGIVKNKMVRISVEPFGGDLAEFVRVLNETLCGQNPAGVTIGHIKRLEAAARNNCIDLLAKLIEFLKEISEGSNEVEINLEGEGHLLEYPEYRDIEKARELFGFFNGVHSVEWFPMSDDLPVVVRIGEENLARPLRDTSLMVASCSLGGGYTGYVGIVGPTRMHYSRLAARLSYFARGLSAVIKDIITEEETRDGETDDMDDDKGK